MKVKKVKAKVVSEQVEAPLENLSGGNVYGEVFIRRAVLIVAMEKLGLKIDSARGGRSSLVAFRGVIDKVSVVVNANAVRTPPGKNNFDDGYTMIISYEPEDSPNVTHFKMKEWIPTNVTLKGKGRDGKAWKIFHMIREAIEGRPAGKEI